MEINFFFCLLIGCYKAKFRPLTREERPAYSMLINAHYLIRPEGYREFLNKLDHKARQGALVRDSSQDPSNLELTRYPIVPISPIIEKANINDFQF